MTADLPGVVTVVADITNAHQGWQIRVQTPADGPMGLRSRTFVLGRGFTRGPSKGCVRTWTRPDAKVMVGLVDDQTSPGVIGQEHHYLADTRCELIRPVTPAARRRHREATVQPTGMCPHCQRPSGSRGLRHLMDNGDWACDTTDWPAGRNPSTAGAA